MIPRLEDLTFAQRFLLTLIIVFVLLFAMAAFGFFTGGWDKADAEAAEPQLYGDTPLDAVLIRLDKRALDEAYHQRVIRLWETWLSPTTRDAVAFTNGLRIARQRYGEAATAISRRERQVLDQEHQHQESK
jgi:hypothetical protein